MIISNRSVQLKLLIYTFIIIKNLKKNAVLVKIGSEIKFKTHYKSSGTKKKKGKLIFLYITWEAVCFENGSGNFCWKNLNKLNCPRISTISVLLKNRSIANRGENSPCFIFEHSSRPTFWNIVNSAVPQSAVWTRVRDDVIYQSITKFGYYHLFEDSFTTKLMKTSN